MNTMLSNWWIFFGALAFVLVIVNIVRTMIGKSKNWEVLMFLSLSGGALALVAEYQMISRWALAGDWSAIQDVAPFMGSALLWLALFGILLNAVLLYMNVKKKG